MDKVITDGIDVSGCIYYNSEKFANCGMFALGDFKCEGQICLFKQLKRLQAENEQIKKDYAKLHIDFAKCNEENKQLKKSIDRIMQNKEIKTIDSEIALLNAELQQENKRLIARLRPLEDSYFNGLSTIEIAELAKKSIRITAENRKLEDALQEIRDMATLFHSVNENKGLDRFKNNILDKINEVIGAE